MGSGFRSTLSAVLMITASVITVSAREPEASPAPAAIVDEVWQLVDEHFMDPAFNGADWPALRERYLEQAAQLRTEPELGALINEMLGELDTSHTHYFSPNLPEHYQLLDVFKHPLRDWIQERMPPEGVVIYPGIGLVTRSYDDRDFVIGKIHGTPASRSLIAVGDELVSVDGEPFDGVRSFKGKVGQLVRVTAQRSPSPSSRRDVEVVPGHLQPTEMYVKAIRTSARVVQRGDLSIAYVRVWSYAGEHYHQEVVSVLGEPPLRDADALVLDIRDGWGGASAEYLNLFNDKVPLLETRPRGGEWRAFETQWRKPVVLLVNGGTRSGKEVLTHGFKRYGIGPVVGSRTAGAVTAGRVFRLSNDALLYVAVADVLVDGDRLEGRGVVPDFEVPFDVRYAGGRDPQLDKAYEIAARTAREASQARE